MRGSSGRRLFVPERDEAMLPMAREFYRIAKGF
jgi:hypothetical protein